MTYQVIIPMTGVGQRFVDAGYKELKPLIDVDGKTIVHHVLNMFEDAQRTICIISGEHPQKEKLIAEILRIRPSSIIQEISAHKLGPGHAILQAREVIDPELPALVSYCDWAGIWNVKEMLEQLEVKSGSILTYTGFHPHMMRSTKFAYVRKINNLVIDIQEKQPFTDHPMSEEASSGCYGFKSGEILIDALRIQVDQEDNLNGEYYVSLTYKNLLKNGHKVGTVQMKKFFQWGTPEDLQDWQYWKTSVKALPGKSNDDLPSHNIILAAGRGSRIADIAEVSKPNILIAGQHLWEFSAPSGTSFKSSVIVTRKEVGVTSRHDVKMISIPNVTEGQAITARIGIETIDPGSTSPVNVLSSDNAFTPEIFGEVQLASQENDLTLWTTKKYPLSHLNPGQYAWVNLASKKVIKKNTPPNFNDWELIVGNFTFSNKELAIELINELVAKDIRVNNEFYLDSLIELSFERDLKVTTCNVGNFIAIGTPEEFFTYNYFKDL